MPTVDQVSIELRSLNQRFTRGMREAEQDVARFGRTTETSTAGADRGFGRLQDRAGRLAGVMRAAIGPAVAAAIGAGLVTAGRNAAEFAGHLQVVADTTGRTAESLQELHFGFRQNDVDIQAVDTALLKLNQRIGEVAAGSTGPAAKIFEQYGIAVRDAAGEIRDADDVLDDIADAFANASSTAERGRIAQALFEEAGQKLIATLAQGSEGLNEYRQAAQDAGAVMSNEVVQAGAELDSKLQQLTQRIDTDFKTALINLGPVIEIIVGGLALLARTANAAIDAISAIADESFGFGAVANAEYPLALTDPADVANVNSQAVVRQMIARAEQYRDATQAQIDALTPDDVNFQFLETWTQEVERANEALGTLRFRLEELGGRSDLDLNPPDVDLGSGSGGRGAAATAEATAAADQRRQAEALLGEVLRETATAEELHNQRVAELLQLMVQYPEHADRIRQRIEQLNEAQRAANDNQALWGEVLAATTTEEEAHNARVAQLLEMMTLFPERAERIREYLDILAQDGTSAGEVLYNAFQTATEGIGQLFSDLVDTTTSYMDDIRSYALRTVSNILDNMLNAFGSVIGNAAGDWLGGLLDLPGPGQRRAAGGPALAGSVYQVNERGQEFFRPGTTGRVIPANEAFGQGLTINQSIDARGSQISEARLQQVSYEATSRAVSQVLGMANRGGDAAKVIGRRRK